jgi:predicted NUDIX family phosphoesterase
MNEEVMVLRRETLAPYIAGRTFDLIAVDIRDLIEREHFFIPRATAEVSPQFKQIIPYVVIRHADSFFLLQRLAKQTEARLHHKLSLGIGGHINPDTPTVLGGLRKELEEEVHVDSTYDLHFVGILNDDTTEVGQVHLGAVFELVAERPTVTIRETEKMTGQWTARPALAPMREAMETWSQLVYDGFIRPS